MSYDVFLKLDIQDSFELAVENIGYFELHCVDLVICSIQITIPIHITIFHIFFLYTNEQRNNGHKSNQIIHYVGYHSIKNLVFVLVIER